MTQDWKVQAYAAHHQLLKRIEVDEHSPGVVAEAEALIQQVRQAGEHTAAPAERDYLNSLLTFWANWVYQHTRVYPNTELYPPSPQASERAAQPAVRPLPYQTLLEGAGENVIPPARGLPYLMVNIVSPVDGYTAAPGERLTLSGIYANLQPEWRIYFAATERAGELRLLDDGFAPPAPRVGGAWSSAQPVSFDEPGARLLGVLVAVTPDAVRLLTEARASGLALTVLPAGTLPFLELCVLIIR